MSMNPHKEHVRDTFNSVADGYDNPSTRFFPFCADRLVNFVRPRPGIRVLDVATGTGAVLVPFAQAIGPSGRITGIDLSPGMLDRAEANVKKMALTNVDLHEMDAEHLDFRNNYFDYAVCSYGLFFMPDMQAALLDWVRVLKPGGTLAFTCFETSAFQPMLDNFATCLQEFGVELPNGLFGSQRITSMKHCQELLAEAGIEQITVECAQLGYHLKDETEWWEVVTNTAMRPWFDRIEAREQAAFREQHLAFVAQQKTDDGLWMDVQTRFSSGIKPV